MERVSCHIYINHGCVYLTMSPDGYKFLDLKYQLLWIYQFFFLRRFQLEPLNIDCNREFLTATTMLEFYYFIQITTRDAITKSIEKIQIQLPLENCNNKFMPYYVCIMEYHS